MTDGLAGLRRQLTFEEAARLADVEGPPITYDYAALRLCLLYTSPSPRD